MTISSSCARTASQIIEVIAMSALAVYANTIADATQLEADDMFFG